MQTVVWDAGVEAVRRFNRFYTRQIGLLDEVYLRSQFSLAEARVLYELAHQEHVTATEISQWLGLDSGYLSRIVRRFEQQGLVKKSPSPSDGRQVLLRLTETGQAAFRELEQAASEQVAAQLERLRPDERQELLRSMDKIMHLLGAPSERAVAFELREPQPGDMGWIVQQHGRLYAQEYGWNSEFEALVAGVVAAFCQQHDPSRERCWIATVHDEPVGSIMLVKKSDEVAKLRLLLLLPSVRGLGIGKRMVRECIAFARAAGYRSITLWTQQNLTAARALYASHGFRMVESAPHHSFGHDLVEETWELDLTA